jgi:superfamily II DNA or RNA helicase
LAGRIRSFNGKIVQYAGRLHRFHKDKQAIRIYDYVDVNVSVLARMFRKRLKTYKMLGYSVDGEQESLAIYGGKNEIRS